MTVTQHIAAGSFPEKIPQNLKSALNVEVDMVRLSGVKTGEDDTWSD